MTIIDTINTLKSFWRSQKCIEIFHHDVPVGAGTFHPTCFFNAIGASQNNYMYVNPCRRLGDGRYGNSNQRLLKHHQFQVIVKAPPETLRSIYLESLQTIGITDPIRFIDNNWKSESIGAYGKGWETLCNLTEIAQFTFFEKVGDTDVKNITIEIAYGLERLVCVKNNLPINDVLWYGNNTYRDIRYQEEKGLSGLYNEINYFSHKDFHGQLELCGALLDKNNFYGAYEVLLMAIYMFNCLDANKQIGPLEYREYMTQTRDIAKRIVYIFQNNN